MGLDLAHGVFDLDVWQNVEKERGGNERFRRTKVVEKERNQEETLCLGIFFLRRTDAFNGG